MTDHIANVGFDHQSAPRLETLVQDAEVFHKADRFAEAMAVYEIASKHYPPNRTVLIRLAGLSVRMGQLDKAQEYLGDMRRYFPDFQWTPMVEGDLAVARFDYTKAIAHYREALGRMPDQTAVKTRLDNALAEHAREFSWNAPVEIEIWPASGPSRFLEAPPQDRVLVVSWDLGHNVAGRGITMAETICDTRPTAMAGPLFPTYGDALWSPLAEADRRVPIAGWRAPHFHHFLEGALKLVKTWPAATVWVSKPRFPGLLIGLLYREILGARIICDLDDDELAFVKGSAPRDFNSFLAEFNPQDWDRPHGRTWTELGMGILPFVDAVTSCNPVLASRNSATLVRHGRSQIAAQNAMARRDATRSEFGYAPSDRVVLFLGTPRRHKGLVELAHAVVALNRPDVELCIVGSVADPDMERELSAIPGLKLRRIGAQPFSRVLDLNAVADVVVLLQDHDSPITQSQTPAKLTDAIAVGTPVLVTEAGPVADVIASGAAMAIRKGDVLVRRLEAALAVDRQSGHAHPFFTTEMSYEANRPRALQAIAAAHAAAPRVYPDMPGLLSFLRREMPGVLSPDIGTLSTPWLAPTSAPAPLVDPDQPINVVFFWKQNDSGLYGRRQDMLLHELSLRPEVGRILHIDAPFPVTDLRVHTNPMRAPVNAEAPIIAATTLARMTGLADEGNIHRRSFLIGSQGQTMLGRPVHSHVSFPNAVEAWMDDLDMRTNCIAWVCPVVQGFEEVQQRLRFPFVIGDYIDDQRCWPMSEQRRRKIEQNYRFMAQTVDVAITNCAAMQEALTQESLSPLLVPNGIDMRAEMPVAAPEITRLGGPVIGYCGNMDDRFDFELVEALARARPQWQIVLIGKLSRPAHRDRMTALPNVHLLGIRPYDQARACIAGFDVAIVPHERSDLSDRMNPLKVYVYRALGLPVVATDIANLDDLRDDLTIAEDADGFVTAIEAALVRVTKQGRRFLPLDLRASLSWQNRMDTIWSEVDQRLRFKMSRSV
ncbi:MAG: glycosyltransferase [Roseovarius sp.]|jgi:glycosyltransferase involved in cell wall biosynthesis|nr:glycosyltransferase [Roseovarius sp.]